MCLNWGSNRKCNLVHFIRFHLWIEMRITSEQDKRNGSFTFKEGKIWKRDFIFAAKCEFRGHISRV